eukprot:5296913-Pyramimonas_sp.AAC.1
MPRPSQKTNPPYVFPTVKSKCFQDDGARCCSKSGHSCMRRIVNSAGAPGAEGFRCIGRASRRLMQASGLSSEVFNMSHAAREVRAIVSELEPPANDTCL